jgi:hypothetical protein
MNWCRRHLNWTTILGAVAVFMLAALAQAVLALAVPLASQGTYGALAATIWLVGLPIVWGWVLKQKGRSLWWLLLVVFVPFGFIAMFTLQDRTAKWHPLDAGGDTVVDAVPATAGATKLPPGVEVRIARVLSEQAARNSESSAAGAEAGIAAGYMEVPEANPGGDGICSDNDCPCGYPGATIPRGSGYIYISQEVVDFRRDAPSMREAERKIANLRQDLGGTVVFGQGIFAPILMCEQGARKRGLDLQVAAADARYWWETGLVPLRATPAAGSRAARQKRARPKSAEDSRAVSGSFDHTLRDQASAALEQGLDTGVIFDRKMKRGQATYELYTADEAEKAKTFLLNKKVTRGFYYVEVETPNGHWGIDKDGIYLVELLPWQKKLSLGKCEGQISAWPSIHAITVESQGLADNSVAKIRCGKCEHEWWDAIRLQKATIVRCPKCLTHNKIRGGQINVTVL